MATTLIVTGIKAGVTTTYANARSSPLTSTSDAQTFNFAPASLSNGTGALNADRILAQVYTITASGNQNVVLTSFTDPFGNTVSMLRVKYIYVALTNTTSATTILCGNGTNPLLFGTAASVVRVRNGGAWQVYEGTDATGIAISAGVSDALKILNEDGANSATVQVCIIGCSA